MVTTTKSKLKQLEDTQNNVLRLVCGIVKTTPVVALQVYTNNHRNRATSTACINLQALPQIGRGK